MIFTRKLSLRKERRILIVEKKAKEKSQGEEKGRARFTHELSKSFMEYCNDEERRSRQAIKYLEKAREIDRCLRKGF